MRKILTFDDLWPHLEPLSRPEIEAIYAAAQSDIWYKACLFGAFLGYAASVVGLSLAIPAFYRAYQPALPLKLGAAVAVLLGIWLAVRLLIWLNQGFYNQAVMRQIRRRAAADGA